jgi:uncharacterized protein (DUF1015 family)
VASIRPFRGVRYDPTVVHGLESVVAAPYDIIAPDAQRELYARSPYNVVRLELGAESPADGPGNDRYSRAAATYREWREQGVVRVDDRPVFYLYDEDFSVAGARLTRRSLLAPVRLARFEENVVLPHEHTLPKAKADRLHLLEATHTQFSPILGTYDAPNGVTAILAAVAATPPLVEISLRPGLVAASAGTHRLWAITSAEHVAELTTLWQPLQIFLADGHHRYETALTYRDEQRAAGATPDAASEYALFALVAMADRGLMVFPTHRLVRGLSHVDGAWILRHLAEIFAIERLPTDRANLATGSDNAMLTDHVGAPTVGLNPTIAVLGLDPGWVHRLTVRPDVDLAQIMPNVPAVLRHLDTVILQRLIFERVLGLASAEAAADDRIQYTRDPAEAAGAFGRGDAQLVFFLGPTPIALIREATRAGVRMPQKTTYFYPKPVTGLVFFDQDNAWST